MEASDSSTARNPFEEVADEFLQRHRNGESPEIEDYCAQYPEHAEQIRKLFPTLLMMEGLDDPSAESTSSGTFVPAADSATTDHPESIGDFRILREVGRGGMGIVYEAEQKSLGRRVALKVLPASFLQDQKQIDRFEREARSAARLHHTNIVPVFGVGASDGRHYYVMQFIQGRGLDEVIDELRQLRAADSGSLAGALPVPASTPPAHASPAHASILSGVARSSPKSGSGDPPTPQPQAASRIAHSLMSGQFTRIELELEHSDEQHDGKILDASSVFDDVGSDSVTDHEVTQASSPLANPRRTLPVTEPLSSSAHTLSGSSNASQFSQTSSRHEYWKSVARIGVQVADALEYASGQGILHRDIKPANLLLDLEGTTWVTDFGLAKLVEDEDLTKTGDILGTLRYMSPERFEGFCDVRADIYSLGLTLFELVTLRPAFDEKDRHQLIQKLTQTEVPPLRRLNSAVPMDLETIIHKATARERERRYQTPAELAADLRCFLDDKPIAARRIGISERLYRWSRRNPAIAGLTASVLLALIVAFVTVTWLWRRADRLRLVADVQTQEAEKNRAEADRQRRLAEQQQREAERQKELAQSNLVTARRAVDELFTRVSERQSLKVPELQQLRTDLLQAAQRFHQGFLNQSTEESELQTALAFARLRLGRILKETEMNEARKVLKEAQAAFENLVEKVPNDAELQHGLAECLHELDLQSPRARRIWEELVETHPADPRFRTRLGEIYNRLALLSEGNPARRLQYHQMALSMQEQVARSRPDDDEAQAQLGATVNNIATLLTAQERHDEKLRMYQRFHALIAQAITLAPEDRQWIAWARIAARNERSTAAQLNMPEAQRTAFEFEVAALGKAVEVSPLDPAPRAALADVYQAFADFEQQHERTEVVHRLQREAIRVLQAIPEKNGSLFYKLAQARAIVAGPELSEQVLADLQAAIDAGYRSFQELRQNERFAAYRERPEFKLLVQLASALQSAETAADASQRAEAWREVVLLRTQLAESRNAPERDRPGLITAYTALGSSLSELGQHQDALAAMEHALELQRSTGEAGFGEDHTPAQLITLFQQLGDGLSETQPGLALNYWQRALALIESELKATPSDSRKTEFVRLSRKAGNLAVRQGLYEDAARMLAPLVPGQDPTRFSFDHYRLLLLLALVEDTQQRTEHYEDLWSRFQEHDSPDELERISKTWLCVPLGTEELARATAMANRAVTLGKGSQGLAWYQANQALALYRNGDFEQAVNTARLSLEHDTPADFWGQRLSANLVLALSYSELDKPLEAREALSRAREVWGRHAYRPAGHLSSWNENALVGELLRREAESRIEIDESLPLANVDFSITAWLKTTAPSGVVLCRIPADATWVVRSKCLGIRNGCLCFDAAGGPSLTTPLPINDGAWHHIALTHRAIDGLTRLYVDGEQLASAVITTPDGVSHRVHLGTRIPEHAPAFTGSLDEIQFLQRTLAREEIQLLSQTSEESELDGIVAHWRFDEPDGRDVPNHLGADLAGTLENGHYAPGHSGSSLVLDGNGGVAIQPRWTTSTDSHWTRQYLAVCAVSRGTALLQLGRMADAEHELSKLDELGPANPNVLLDRSRAWSESGEWERAAADVQRALKLITDKSAHNTIAAERYADLGASAWQAKQRDAAAEFWDESRAARRALLAESPDPRVRAELLEFEDTLAENFVNVADWSAAAEHLAAAIELEGKLDWSNRQYSLLSLLQLADQPEHRRKELETMWETYRDSQVPEYLDRVGKSWLLEPLQAEELQHATQLVEKAVRLGKGSENQAWFQVNLALAHYRNARYSESIEAAQDARNLPGGTNPAIVVIAKFVTAMAQCRKGDMESAHQSYSDAIEVCELYVHFPNGRLKPFKIESSNPLHAHLLRRETEAMLGIPAQVNHGPTQE